MAGPRWPPRRMKWAGARLSALAAWLGGHCVEAAAMEATGVFWETPLDALAEAGVEV